MEEKVLEWQKIKYPEIAEIVYVIYAEKKGFEKPIYVGETGRNIGRFGDYISMNFKAATDFRVGYALRYLEKNGFNVFIKYKGSKNRQDEEHKLHQKLVCEFNLLNSLPGYNYKSADKSSEETTIRKYCDNKIISQW